MYLQREPDAEGLWTRTTVEPVPLELHGEVFSYVFTAGG
jgi:hypothetical protein